MTIETWGKRLIGHGILIRSHQDLAMKHPFYASFCTVYLTNSMVMQAPQDSQAVAMVGPKISRHELRCSWFRAFEPLRIPNDSLSRSDRYWYWHGSLDVS